MDAFFNPRRTAARSTIERGIARGELRGDLDMEVVRDAILGPMLYSVLFRKADTIRLPGFPERLIDLLMRGIDMLWTEPDRW